MNSGKPGAQASVVSVMIVVLEAVITALRGIVETPSGAPASAGLPPKPSDGRGKIDLSQHDGAWKAENGLRLSNSGRQAICDAFASGMTIAEVARLFKIGPGSAKTYKDRYEGHRSDWPDGVKPIIQD